MPRYKPPAMAVTPPLEPVDGFFFATPQRFLTFGSNRRTPVTSRPALSVSRKDRFAVLLPATSNPRNKQEFFKLAEEDVRWTQCPGAAQTYLYRRIETLAVADLGGKIGVVSQNARMKIAGWLRGRRGAA